MIEQTLSIIKPTAVRDHHIGEIIARFEKADLKIAAMKMKQLSRQEAEEFYAIHREKPFYNELVDMMISGPVVVQVLQGENAIEKNRKVMGATDPQKAEEGTIRKDYGISIGENAVHGSDAPDTAQTEIAFFFKESEICS